MPLNGRMVFMLNRLAGGVNWQVPTFGATGTSGLRPFDNQGGSAWSLNGGRLATNEFLVDGAPDSTRGRYNFSPPADSVEEFKIQTNTYDAQYGRTGGGIVNATLKTGGNQMHGRVWNLQGRLAQRQQRAQQHPGSGTAPLRGEPVRRPRLGPAPQGQDLLHGRPSRGCGSGSPSPSPPACPTSSRRRVTSAGAASPSTTAHHPHGGRKGGARPLPGQRDPPGPHQTPSPSRSSGRSIPAPTCPASG